jgi:hypothetical protein
MRQHQRRPKKDLHDVELADRKARDVMECIDYDSSQRVTLVIFFYCLFLVFFCYQAFRSPSRVLYKSGLVPVRLPSTRAVNATIDLRFTAIPTIFNLSCQAVRPQGSLGSPNLSAHFSETHRFKSGGEVSEVSKPRGGYGLFMFPEQSTVSSPVSLLSLEAPENGSVLLSINFRLKGIQNFTSNGLSFLFSYFCVSPEGDEYVRKMRVFCAVVVLYALVIYVLSWNQTRHADKTCLLLGLLGMLSCNPFGNVGIPPVVDLLLQSLFVAFFRFFLHEKVQSVVLQRASSDIRVFFIILGAVDFAFHFGLDVIPRSRIVVLYVIFLLLYGGMIVSMWVQACMREVSLPHEGTRTFCFGLVQFFSLFFTIVRDVGGLLFAGLAASPGPALLLLGARYGGVAACLFWLREYHQGRLPDNFESRFSLDSSDQI